MCRKRQELPLKDYYYILGIPRTADEEEIKAAFRKLSTKFHPDKNNGDRFFEERFKDLTEAYEVLTNRNRKIVYDKLIEQAMPQEVSFGERASAPGAFHRKKRQLYKVGVIAAAGSIGFSAMIFSFFTGDDTYKPPAPETPIYQGGVNSPGSSIDIPAYGLTAITTIDSTEQWLVKTLEAYTPREIFKKDNLNLGWDTASGYYERRFKYAFEKGLLVVEYHTYYGEREPDLLRTTIPVGDIERVYLRNGALHITTATESIVENSRLSKTQFKSGVFSVKLKDNSAEVSDQIANAFSFLKKHYSYRR